MTLATNGAIEKKLLTGLATKFDDDKQAKIINDRRISVLRK